MGRPDEARQTIDQALKQFPNSEDVHWMALSLALTFDKPDEAQSQLAWAKGRPGEFRFLILQAHALQSEGKLRLSNDLTQQALEMERAQNLKEVESSDLSQLAMVQADFGSCEQARKTS